MTKIITLYNHKGGVSKTTTSFNLAHALVERSKQKVLLVDADPQCNLTELAMARELELLDERLLDTGDEGVLPGSTVLEALRDRFDGERPDVDVESIDLVQLVDGGGLALFRGDVDLSDAEDRLSAAHSQRVTTEMHQRRTYVAVHDMLRRLAERDQYDWVIVDVGPSAGALTRSFFLACDGFLVPVAPDRFNYQAVGSLTTILVKWIKEHRMIVDDFRDVGLNVSDGSPVFLGLVMQRYQRYANEPKKSFRIWMDKIADKAKGGLLPALREAAGIEGIVPDSRLSDPSIAQIPDFTGLGPIMLSAGKPVWQLTKDDTAFQGRVWEQTVDRLKDFKDLHFALADSLTDA